jgi:hypothetical protein
MWFAKFYQKTYNRKHKGLTIKREAFELEIMKTLGLWEYILIRRMTDGKWMQFKAKLDTGADRSRIGAKEAAQLGLEPIKGVHKTTTFGNGRKETRRVVSASVRIGGHRINVKFRVSTSKSGVLIGRSTMKTWFKISPSQEYLSDPRKG